MDLPSLVLVHGLDVVQAEHVVIVDDVQGPVGDDRLGVVLHRSLQPHEALEELHLRQELDALLLRGLDDRLPVHPSRESQDALGELGDPTQLGLVAVPTLYDTGVVPLHLAYHLAHLVPKVTGLGAVDGNGAGDVTSTLDDDAVVPVIEAP